MEEKETDRTLPQHQVGLIMDNSWGDLDDDLMEREGGMMTLYRYMEYTVDYIGCCTSRMVNEVS
jgi:hypothetical protein